ncbi:hypothetical protein ACFQGW_04790 [Xanthomonas theicola]|uniref:hypothetical protein n=1 Tax=Xanthomonas theicola TaxID=56464 RepID=UPI00361448FA
MGIGRRSLAHESTAENIHIHAPFVGIDVAKAERVTHVLPDALAWTQARASEKHALLAERLAPMGCERIVLEASGGDEQAVLQALAQASLPVMPLPAQLPGRWRARWA